MSAEPEYIEEEPDGDETWRIVECRLDGQIFWLGLVRTTAKHAVVLTFHGEEVKLRMVRRAELGHFQNAAALEDAR